MEFLIYFGILIGGTLIELLIILMVKQTKKRNRQKNKYIVSFVIDGKTITEEYRKGDYVDFKSKKTESGCAIEGWYDNKDFTGKNYEYFMVYLSDMTFYAKLK